MLEAYYADAIDREVFRTHQRRLNADQANLVREKARLESANTEILKHVRDALGLLQDVHATYVNAPVTVRKQLNQAIFAGIFLGPEPDQIRAELNELFASITQPGGDPGNPGRLSRTAPAARQREPTRTTRRARKPADQHGFSSEPGDA